MRFKITVVIALFALTIVWADSGGHQYVGVSKCKTCHKIKKYGDQFGKWEQGPHAKAFQVLASEQSLKIAKEMGIDDPQKSEKCLTCHVTAFNVADSMKADTYTMEEGVGCESCHGAGADYLKMSVMKDVEQAIANGLMIPTKETCLTCHNDKSPTFKEFDFEARKKEIAHPKPAAE